MRPVTLLTARVSKDGKRVLCGNRQCRHPGLAQIERGKRFNQALRLAKGFDRRRDGTYAFTNRAFERTNYAFQIRQGLREYGESSGMGIVMSLADLGIVRRAEDYAEQPQVMIHAINLKDEPVTVRCPRCHNCSLITEQIFTGGMPARRIL